MKARSSVFPVGWPEKPFFQSPGLRFLGPKCPKALVQERPLLRASGSEVRNLLRKRQTLS